MADDANFAFMTIKDVSSYLSQIVKQFTASELLDSPLYRKKYTVE